jgi:hypothetical protein
LISIFTARPWVVAGRDAGNTQDEGAATISDRVVCTVGHTDDRDHLFRSIATSVARALTAPLDGGGDVSLLMAGQAR